MHNLILWFDIQLQAMCSPNTIPAGYERCSIAFLDFAHNRHIVLSIYFLGNSASARPFIWEESFGAVHGCCTIRAEALHNACDSQARMVRQPCTALVGCFPTFDSGGGVSPRRFYSVHSTCTRVWPTALSVCLSMWAMSSMTVCHVGPKLLWAQSG
ncbi:Uncharacterised protein [Segatella buccae]|uniref:Uncharacterized protein n=1 Tax=Segatella buccae TaxID=28126 RepID=A0AAQ1UIT9_9BACT|nr:Uncharacterised protein [Segatella buccae]